MSLLLELIDKAESQATKNGFSGIVIGSTVERMLDAVDIHQVDASIKDLDVCIDRKGLKPQPTAGLDWWEHMKDETISHYTNSFHVFLFFTLQWDTTNLAPGIYLPPAEWMAKKLEIEDSVRKEHGYPETMATQIRDLKNWPLDTSLAFQELLQKRPKFCSIANANPQTLPSIQGLTREHFLELKSRYAKYHE